MMGLGELAADEGRWIGWEIVGFVMMGLGELAADERR